MMKCGEILSCDHDYYVMIISGNDSSSVLQYPLFLARERFSFFDETLNTVGGNICLRVSTSLMGTSGYELCFM